MPNASTHRPFFAPSLSRPRALTRALALALALGAAGCGLRGSGTPASELREVEAFDKIELGGTFSLVVHVQPEATQKVQLTADDNILPKIRSSVIGGELELEFEQASLVRPKVPIEIEVWVPTLRKVEVSGTAELSIDGLHGERFELDSSGASDSTLSGAVDQLVVDLSGAGELDARQLQAKIVEVELSGAGEAEVFASERLEVDISGAGEVGYWGEPATVNQDISGAGSLSKRG